MPQRASRRGIGSTSRAWRRKQPCYGYTPGNVSQEDLDPRLICNFSVCSIPLQRGGVGDVFQIGNVISARLPSD